MKAKDYDRIRTVMEVREGLGGHRVFPAGTERIVVECHAGREEGYAVGLAIRDDSWVTGFDYANVILTPEHFEIVDTD